MLNTQSPAPSYNHDFLVKLFKFNGNQKVNLGIGILLKEDLILTSSSIFSYHNQEEIRICYQDREFLIKNIEFLQKMNDFSKFFPSSDNEYIDETLLSERNFCLFTIDSPVHSTLKHNFKLESLVYGYNCVYLKNNIISKFTIISSVDNYLYQYENFGISKDNSILFTYTQKEVMIGSPVYIHDKQILVGIVTYCSKKMMVAYKFDDIKKITCINLESFKEKGNNKMTIFLNCYKEIERLEKINFVNTKLSSEELFKLSSLFKFMKNLKFLNVSRLGSNFQNDHLSKFLINIHSLKNLEYLSLNQCCIDKEAIFSLTHSLQHLFSLKVLLLKGNLFDDYDVSYLTKSFDFLHELNELDLSKNKITKYGINIIDQNKYKLKKLIKLFF